MPSTGDLKDGTGHVRRQIRGQEQCCRGDLGRFTGTAHRDLSQFGVPNTLRHCLGHGRTDQTGCNGVDAHPKVSEFLGGSFRQPDDAGLGRGIICLADQADLPEIEDMLMIAPLRCSRMIAAAARVPFQLPFT